MGGEGLGAVGGIPTAENRMKKNITI